MFTQAYTPAKDLLKSRCIIVTGAGDGIGRACALSYADHGANVILLGKTVRKLESVYDEIVDTGGPEPAIYPMDLAGANTQHYAEMAARIADEFGRLDGLLHNAGQLGSLMPIEHFELNLWSQVMHVNVTAALMMTQACLPLLRQSADASLIFTSSGVGRKGRAYWGAYAVSKFATEGLMEVIADELANTSVRCNCINPGAVRTRMRAAAYPAEDPASRPDPKEIMAAYLYLMGPDGRDSNGQSLDAQ